MTHQTRWEESNGVHLAAALDWVRLRLTRVADLLDVEAPPAGPSKRPERSLFRSRETTPRHEPPATIGDLDQAIDRAERRVAELEDAGGTPPALVVLARRLGLSRFERDALLLAAAVELDTRLA